MTSQQECRCACHDQPEGPTGGTVPYCLKCIGHHEGSGRWDREVFTY